MGVVRLPVADPGWQVVLGLLVQIWCQMVTGVVFRISFQWTRTGRETLPLPREATTTLYVERLPLDSTKRNVAHIFRPFVGYKEVRLVIKESKLHGGDPLIPCFVDFDDPALLLLL